MLGSQEIAAPYRDREADVYRIYSLPLTKPGTSHGQNNNPR